MVPLLLLSGSEAAHGPASEPAILLALALVLVAAKLAGDLVARVGQPAVLAELLVGILLGNLALFGGPDLHALAGNETFAILANLGAVLLLFHVGLESTPREMLAVGGRATLVAVVGVMYGVLVASVVIIVWAQFDAARRAVDHEAGDVATLFRLAAGLPDPYDEQLISAVREYTRVVPATDWPASRTLR